ncbi:MAG TPA: hypothetical protein VEH84_14235 [Alphaproteobacteria bacterium]|nr:hypothetical protein [Alphaproteobacteria bacterium]
MTPTWSKDDINGVNGDEQPKRRSRIPQAAWPDIIHRHNAGETLTAIARDYDCTPSAISYIINKVKKGSGDEGAAEAAAPQAEAEAAPPAPRRAPEPPAPQAPAAQPAPMSQAPSAQPPAAEAAPVADPSIPGLGPQPGFDRPHAPRVAEPRPPRQPRHQAQPAPQAPYGQQPGAPAAAAPAGEPMRDREPRPYQGEPRAQQQPGEARQPGEPRPPRFEQPRRERTQSVNLQQPRPPRHEQGRQDGREGGREGARVDQPRYDQGRAEAAPRPAPEPVRPPVEIVPAEPVDRRLHDTGNHCLDAYKAWTARPDDATLSGLQNAVHELRKVLARIEIEAAARGGKEQGRSFEFPPYRRRSA